MKIAVCNCLVTMAKLFVKCFGQTKGKKLKPFYYNRFSNVATIAVLWALPLYMPPPGRNSIMYYVRMPTIYDQPSHLSHSNHMKIAIDCLVPERFSYIPVWKLEKRVGTLGIIISIIITNVNVKILQSNRQVYIHI